MTEQIGQPALTRAEYQATFERTCCRCGQTIDTGRDSWKMGSNSREIAHVTCPTSPELAALPSVASPEAMLLAQAGGMASPEAMLLAQAADPSPQYVTQREAADLLRVHINTIANKIKSGDLPALRVKGGRSILLDRRDVLALLERIPVEPVPVGETNK